MRKRITPWVFWPAVSLMFAFCAITTSAKGSPSKGSTTCGYSVTSVVHDTDNFSTPFQLQSDALGAYVTTSGSDEVTSTIFPSCNWGLDTSTSTSRGLTLTFNYPAQSVLPVPPFVGPQVVQGAITTVCSFNTLNNGISFGNMTYVGQTADCGMAIRFDYGGRSYSLIMDPNNQAPGTSWAHVTCTGASSGLCNAWTVSPIPPPLSVDNPWTGQLSAIADLGTSTINKGKTTTTDLGLYYVSFSILVHK